MDWLHSLPLWASALMIFLLRITDVSLGTVRTIAVVQGRAKLSVVIGFVESLVWLVAVSQALRGVGESVVLMLAYCGGFAAGNGIGVLLDKSLAMGVIVVRIITGKSGAGREIAATLRDAGWRLTTFDGEGDGGNAPRKLIFAICSRRDAPRLMRMAKRIDPELYYSFDLLREFSAGEMGPLPRPNRWRGRMQRK
ncbi:MAG: hypothetical protein CMJ58_22310 [Planctomycetaceae bacterium]|nr:hypothetical protein [Planctomycetaceae bacterium]